MGSVFVRVEPHLDVGDLYRLFAWTQGTSLTVLDDILGVAGTRPTSFMELLALGLVKEVARLLRSDLLRRWTRRDEPLLLLRGRPRFEAIGSSPPGLGIPCRYQELTSDTLENRLIRAGLEVAVRRLRGPAPAIAAARVGALSHFSVFADLARPMHPDRDDYLDARSIESPRTAKYRAALRLSEWLVLGGGPLSSCGIGGTTGWTLDIKRMFEDAVAKGVGAWAPCVGLTARPQPVHRHAVLDGIGQSYARIIPDIEVLRGQQVIAVVDAKYKSYADASEDGSPRRRVDRDDLYQLAFYGASVGHDPELFIVVPRGRDGGLRDRWRTVLVAGRRLRIVEVDVMAVVKASVLPLPIDPAGRGADPGLSHSPPPTSPAGLRAA